jgi:hypothetical protein
MKHRYWIVALAVVSLVQAVMMLVRPPGVQAQDGDLPPWLVADAVYVGVWKTEGVNTAPDLESQITFGHPGTDGTPLLMQDDKIALRYGVNPVGAPNHSVTNVLATRTIDGFRWGQFDPSRNSAEFAFVVAEGGSSIRGARHAMFNGREFFNTIELQRTEAAAATSARATSDLAPCALNDRFKPVSGQTGRPFAELLAAPPASEAQAKYVGAWQGDVGDEAARLVVFPTNRLQHVWAGMGDGEDANAYRSFQINGEGALTWTSGPAFSYSAVRQEDGSLRLRLVRANGSEDEGTLTPCGV